MQLIDEYEPTRRGVYGGVCGYFDFAGNMDMQSPSVRTAGLVMDSNPTRNLKTVNKSAVFLLRAVLTAWPGTGRADAAVNSPSNPETP